MCEQSRLESEGRPVSLEELILLGRENETNRALSESTVITVYGVITLLPIQSVRFFTDLLGTGCAPCLCTVQCREYLVLFPTRRAARALPEEIKAFRAPHVKGPTHQSHPTCHIHSKGALMLASEGLSRDTLVRRACTKLQYERRSETRSPGSVDRGVGKARLLSTYLPTLQCPTERARQFLALRYGQGSERIKTVFEKLHLGSPCV